MASISVPGTDASGASAWRYRRTTPFLLSELPACLGVPGPRVSTNGHCEERTFPAGVLSPMGLRARALAAVAMSGLRIQPSPGAATFETCKAQIQRLLETFDGCDGGIGWARKPDFAHRGRNSYSSGAKAHTQGLHFAWRGGRGQRGRFTSTCEAVVSRLGESHERMPRSLAQRAVSKGRVEPLDLDGVARQTSEVERPLVLVVQLLVIGRTVGPARK